MGDPEENAHKEKIVEKRKKKEKRAKKEKKKENKHETTKEQNEIQNLFVNLFEKNECQTNNSQSSEEMIYSDTETMENQENRNKDIAYLKERGTIDDDPKKNSEEMTDAKFELIKNQVDVSKKSINLDENEAINELKEYNEEIINADVEPIELQAGCSPIKCSMCNRVYKKQFNLTKHENIEHKGLRFTCPVCDVFTTTKNAMENHVNKRHPQVQKSEPNGRFYWVSNDGKVLSRDGKLGRIMELERNLAKKVKMSEDLRSAIDAIQMKIRKIDGSAQGTKTLGVSKDKQNQINDNDTQKEQINMVQLSDHERILFESYGLSTEHYISSPLNSHAVLDKNW